MREAEINYNKYTLMAAVVLCTIFVVFAYYYEGYVHRKALRNLKRHARVISVDFWNYNTKATTKYLKLASRAHNYDRLTVRERDGEIFQQIALEEPGTIEGWLRAVGLIFRRRLKTGIVYEGERIGVIEATWSPRTFYVYLYVLLVLILVLVAFYFYVRILNAKKSLESKVRARTSELVRANEALEKSLEEKEALLQEIHHRVKNNLFKIISLLEMQEAQHEDEQFREVLTQSVNRIHSMALVHKEIYGSEEYAELELGHYLKQLVEGLKDSTVGREKEVRIEYELAEESLELERSIPVALVVNELVTNALTHGFASQDAGRLKIIFERENSHFTVKVSDNGQGVPETFSLPEDASLGLKLVARIVQNQLRGTLNYHSNDWTTFEFKFPVQV